MSVTVPSAILVASTLDNPKAIVPLSVIGEPESTSIPSEPDIATEVTVPVSADNVINISAKSVEPEYKVLP